MTEKIDGIKVLKEVLGTMVLMPVYETNPQEIGKKVFKGNNQVPILEGENRKIAESKLMELIKSL